MTEEMVALSESDEIEEMKKAIPAQPELKPVADLRTRIDATEEKLKEWIEADDTQRQIPVTALFIADLLIEKNEKYGDAWREFGIFSVVIELQHKLLRIKHMTWDVKKKDWRMSAEQMLNDIDDEGSVFDTIRDIAGYAILAMALFKGADEQRLMRARRMIRRITA